jgi:hypothetical protein
VVDECEVNVRRKEVVVRNHEICDQTFAAPFMRDLRTSNPAKSQSHFGRAWRAGR